MSGHPQRSTIYGTPVTGGIAYAPVLWAQHIEEPSRQYQPVAEADRGRELTRFTAAADIVSDRLNLRSRTTVGTASDLLSVAAVFAADPAWRLRASKLIEDGVPATVACVLATDHFAEVFQQAGGALAERVTDLRDVCMRVVAQLRGEPDPGIPHFDHPVVLFAQDLAPADTAGLDPSKVMALVTTMGGPTSHTAVIARQLGIPCVVAALQAKQIQADTWVLVNADNGTIYLNYDRDEAQKWVRQDLEHRQRIAQWRGPAHLADGSRVELLANVQDADGVRDALTAGADGIGLLRTELCFIHAAAEPSVSEQEEMYARMFADARGAKLVVRTLDAGSDKPLAWATLANELNPALGLRGLRTTGMDEGVLLRQLDALAAAARVLETGPDEGHSSGVGGSKRRVQVMAPMVSTLDEVEWFTGLVRERGMSPGIMVEVPAVTVLIKQFIRLVDFVSIGTNDLTQYVMAADRTSPHLAKYNDAWQPAVLKLISEVAAAGRSAAVPVGVCGEAAADPLLACVLLGLGVSSLSTAPATLPAVGAQLETVTASQCRVAADAALDSPSPIEARRRVRGILR